MLDNWLMPQLLGDFGQTLICQKDGAAPHYHRSMTDFLNRWTGRGGPTAWPPRSPDLTPIDLFLWGCVKDRVYVLPLSSDIKDLKIWIRKVIQSTHRETMSETRNGLLYRLDVIHVTNGTHIRHLWNERRFFLISLFSDSNFIFVGALVHIQ
jgi:hypothetical protein